MSNLSHPMVTRSERNPRAEADGGKDSSIESSVQPRAEMESNIVSSDTTTESQDTDSSDELTELVAAASSPSVSGSPHPLREDGSERGRGPRPGGGTGGPYRG